MPRLQVCSALQLRSKWRRGPCSLFSAGLESSPLGTLSRPSGCASSTIVVELFRPVRMSKKREREPGDALREREACLRRCHRHLEALSLSQLLIAEEAIRRLEPDRTDIPGNPSGSREPLPACVQCGGKKPPAEGAEPWGKPYAKKNGEMAWSGGKCLPCRWSKENSRPREEWPGWAKFRDEQG
eukprot:gnl/TRDRNA2_/TRDRNA2_163337_c0_seq6.p1 gnl/TRDRNA2_/TRDRNA2_163337_c0~~gnl/TRDRNA2_/TRDRNA2_163337_c0_seq6.p1  ORF type:complete len:184 (-),score=22.75 gnl/TRDRNA2_/TRDRNA2_163337_c0_seq6:284-835(-)